MAYRKENEKFAREQISKLLEKLNLEQLDEIRKHADRLANPPKLPPGMHDRFSRPKPKQK